MAEAVVAIVTEGIKPLGEFIIQQANFLSGVGNQVELAQVELQLMGAFLKDADSRAGDDEVVRNWVKLIRDVAYDLEDVIESFALKVAIRRRRGGGTVKIFLKRFACIFSEGVDRHRIGSEIEDIMTRLSHLRLSLQSYNIRQSDPERVAALKFQKQRDQRQTYAHQVESHIVGLEESTDLLVKELIKGGKRLRVLSIWGMGGSGKTTLAKQVFLQNEVKHHFDYFAWVCISQQCEGRDVLEDILIKLTSPSEKQREKIAKMKKDEIAEELCTIQRKSRCLVVIDDIWTREAWRSLEPGFPINEETESRILLTTRKKEVAVHLSGNDHLHQPQPLDGNQSLELFEKIAILGRYKTDSFIYEKKRELGKKMLVHCSGLPLAINVLAGFLSRREKVEEWESVIGSVDKYIMRGTNVLERGNTGQDSGVAGVLALSYDDLPPQLKFCFLYLAQFPEDHEISVNRLSQLWIAEGFITSTSDMHGSAEIMEDEAYSCLVELVERSMVQVVNYGLSGKVKTCRLHDLMRDLCLQKAKEDSFLDVVDFSVGMVSSTSLNGKFRRLAIYLISELKEEEFSSRVGRDDRIRSMLHFNPRLHNLNKKVMRSICNDFKLLRVLKFENIRGFLIKLPKKIGDLVLLRFLSLKNSEFDEVPSSLSNLVLLQTLDLRLKPHVKKFGLLGNAEIKCVYCNMEQLRHLYVPDPYLSKVGKKQSLSKLRNLQTLVNISLDRCDLNDFVQLTKLRKLGISASRRSRFDELKDVLISRNVTYEHLQSLSLSLSGRAKDTIIPTDVVLRCPYLYKLHVYGEMRELPRELLGYPNLTKITLQFTYLDDQIEILEKLPKLRVLHLGPSYRTSEIMVFSQGGFPHLEFLTLILLSFVKEWKVERGAMPCLHRLEIHYCSVLVELPDGLQDVITLKELTISGMPRRFCSRVGQGGEDFYKIKHVPSLIITNIRSDEEDDEPEMEEVAGASQIVSGQAGDSHQESTVDAPPGENTEEIQASSSPNIPC